MTSRLTSSTAPGMLWGMTTEDRPSMDEPLFTCPDCGGREFRLTYRPIPQELPDDATAMELMVLAVTADDSPVYASCARGCEFTTSVTNIEMAMSHG